MKKLLLFTALLSTTSVFAEPEMNAASEPMIMAASDHSYINNEELAESTQSVQPEITIAAETPAKKELVTVATAENPAVKENTPVDNKTVASPTEKTASQSTTASETVELSEGMKIVPKTQHEEDAELRFTIDINYPQIEGATLSHAAQAFNKSVMQIVNQEATQFKKYVKLDQVHMQSLPEDLKHNSLRTDYDIDVIKPSKKTIISVRLSNEGFQAGRAHPYHNHKVLNYDMTEGKLLTLSDLFKPKSNYLSIIAKYANQKLTQKLQDKWMINEGTKPVEKNYQIWNLESDGILFTFDEYQVAPYVYGAQEVEVPYSELKAVLSPKAPIYSCAENAESCGATSN